MELGDFHPLFLHFPIALFIVAFTLDMLHFFSGRSTRVMASWMTIVAAGLALPTIWTGLDASSRFHPDDPTVSTHQLLAYAIGVVGVMHAIIRVGALRGRWFPKPGLTLAMSSLIVVLVCFVADFGGLLARGKTPFRRRSVAAAMGSIAGQPLSKEIVKSDDLMGALSEQVGVVDANRVFSDNNCVACHAQAFPKEGPLGVSLGANPMLPRNTDGTLKDLSSSLFYQTVILRNEMPMPHNGVEGGLTDSERLILLAWLNNGAPVQVLSEKE